MKVVDIKIIDPTSVLSDVPNTVPEWKNLMKLIRADGRLYSVGGWSVTSTGGGCEAMVYDLGNDNQLLATDEAALPNNVDSFVLTVCGPDLEDSYMEWDNTKKAGSPAQRAMIAALTAMVELADNLEDDNYKAPLMENAFRTIKTNLKSQLAELKAAR